VAARLGDAGMARPEQQLMRAIQIDEYGDASRLVLRDVARPVPRADEVLVRIACAGVNFMDVYTRRGVYKDSSPYRTALPMTLGMEGAGVVEQSGEAAVGFQPGQRVVFCLAQGSYADYAAVPASKLVALPDGVTFELAAANYFQGLTAHYLCFDTARVSAGDVCLVYSGAGGVAQNLIGMAKSCGATVIASASGADKRSTASAAGADVVVAQDTASLVAAVSEVTNGRGVDVLFDSVGAELYETSLRLIRRRGIYVCYGSNSGPIRSIDPMALANAGSLMFTRPRLNDHIGTREQLEQRAAGLFALWAGGLGKATQPQTFGLEDAAHAQHALETRTAVGKAILRIG